MLLLTVPPPLLSFEAPLNGSAPAQTISINNSGGSVLNWTVTANQPWIALGAASGTAPSTLLVGVNTLGLAPGNYSGAITIAAAGATNTPQTAAVSLTVLPFASGLSKISGDNQTAAIGSALAQPFVVKATTGNGSAATGVQVKFSLLSQPVGAAGAAFSATTATTDSQGQAQALLTLGNQPGAYQVEVSAAGLAHQTVVFTATATAAVGSLSAAATSITAAPNNIAADGGSRSAITVIPRDASGRNLGPGQTVVLSRTGSGTLSAVTDRGDESYTATLTAPATAGGAVVSAIVNGTAVQQTAAVSFTSGTLPLIVAATTIPCCRLNAIALDAADNLYIANESNSPDTYSLYRIDAITGAVTGITDLLGVYTPSGIAFDRLGNMYYVRLWVPFGPDPNQGRIFKKDTVTGINTAFAGTGLPGVGLDEGPATLAALFGLHYNPYRLAVDRAGNVYLAEYQKDRIRKVDVATGLISTFAGTGTAGFAGDGGPARQAQLRAPIGIAFDAADNLFIADRDNQRIRRVDAVTGVISTVAGNGTGDFTGDGGPATAATFRAPSGVAVDRSGNLYIADTANGRIRKVDTVAGIITTVAGGGSGGLGGPAISANIGFPGDVAIDSAGTLYIISGPGVVFKVPGIGGDVSSALRFLISVVSGNNQSGAVGTALGSPLVVKVSDASGNPVAGRTVTFAITSQPTGAAGATLSAASATTGSDGLASTSLTLGNRVGTYAVTAAVSGLPGLQVAFNANASATAATTLTLVSGDSQSVPVLTTLAAPLVVKVTDANGNAVPGVTVNFAITGTPASATGMLLGASAVPTDAAGFASTTLRLGDILGAYTVTASSPGLAPSVGVVFPATAVSAAITNPFDNSWTGNTMQAGQTPQPWAFVVQGNVIRAFSSQLVLPACGVTLTLTNNVASFALAGNTFRLVDFFSPGNLQRVDISGTFTSPTLASGTFSVSDATCNDSVSGTWTAFAPSAASLMQIRSGNNQEAAASRALSSPFVVRVVDAGGNPVANAAVTFAVAAAPPLTQNTALSLTSAVTNSLGEASTTLTLGSVQGTYLVTATGPGGGQVIFTARAKADVPAKVIKKSGDGQNATPGSVLPVPICVTVTDVFNNAISGLAVNFAITSQPAGATGAQLSVSAANTGTDGTACTRMTGGNQLGAYLETTSFPGTGLAAVTFTVSVNAPQNLSRASGDLQSAVPGATLAAPLVVVATDASGRPIAGVDVSFNISGVPQGATGASVAPTSCRTDAAGQCGTRLTIGSLAGVYSVSAVANDPGGRSLLGSPVTFQALTTLPATLTKSSGDGQFGVVSKPLARSLLVSITDADGRPVGGVPVNFALSASPPSAAGMLADPATTISDANGLAQTRLTLGNQLGSYAVQASATNPSGVALAGSPARFTAVATNPTQIAPSGGDAQTGSTLQALGNPLVVRVTDAAGNGVSGVEVSYTVTQSPSGATGFAMLPAVCTADSDGKCGSLLLLGSQPGAYAVTASAPGLSPPGGVPFTASAQLGATPGPYDGNWTGNATQAGSPARPLGLTIRNSTLTAYSIEFALPQCGITVALTNNAGGVALLGNQFSFTEHFGAGNAIALMLAGSFTSATQASGTFLVTDSSCGGSASGTWTASAPQAGSRVRIFSGNNQTGIVSRALAAPLVALVTDASGNPQPNQPVGFTIAAQPLGTTGTSLSAASATTDANGQASVALTLGTAQGIYLATAAGPAGDQATFLSTARPDVPARTIKRSGDNQNVSPGSVLPVPICVTATDAFNNAIPGLAVAFEITSQPGGSSGASLSVRAASTATQGTACTQMAGGNQLGAYLETTSFPGTSLSPLTFTATVSQPASVQATSGDGQQGVPGWALANPLVVNVRDGGGNPVAGVLVRFAISAQPAGAAGASVSPLACTSSVSGECRATLVLGSLAGNYTVQSTATDAAGNPLAGSPLQFQASAVARTYLAGDAFPAASVSGDLNGDGDTLDAGEFGDAALNTLDLIHALRAVTNVPGFRPLACSDRFDAMDSFPADTVSTRGGDGALTTLDLIITLRRVTNVDPSRPQRPSRGLACTSATFSPMLLQRSEAEAGAAARVEIGAPEASEPGSVRVPVYLRARAGSAFAGLSFAVGRAASGGARLRFIAAQAPRPTVVDGLLPGVLAVAWLEGFQAGAEDRLLLGYVEGDVAALRLYGFSADAQREGNQPLPPRTR